MIEGSLSRRYTKALFQLAREAGQEDKIGQEVEQKARHRLVAAHVSDEHGRIDQVEAQACDSVRRVFRTHAAVASRSRQCE